MESYKFVYGRCSLNVFFIFHENNLSINVLLYHCGNPSIFAALQRFKVGQNSIYLL